MQDQALADFTDLVLKNLHKNGFPQNQVSFNYDKLYQLAYEKGFSFNKVRDTLKGKGIESELADDKIIFRDASQSDFQGSDTSFEKLAEEMLKNMTPEELAKMQEMAKNLDPATIAEMKSQWEKMSPEEKADALKQAKGFKK